MSQLLNQCILLGYPLLFQSNVLFSLLESILPPLNVFQKPDLLFLARKHFFGLLDLSQNEVALEYLQIATMHLFIERLGLLQTAHLFLNFLVLLLHAVDLLFDFL